MAAPYTDIASLQNLVKTAYDRKIRLALRATPQFRAAADTKVVQQTQPGSSVVFNIHRDLAPATAPLSSSNPIDGSVDPTGASIGNTKYTTVTLLEYGNFTVVTKALQEFALDASLDANIANIIAYNLADSVDRVVEAVLATGSNVIVPTATTGTNTAGVISYIDTKTSSDLLGETVVTTGSIDDLTQDHTINSAAIRRAVERLRTAAVPTRDGMNYVGYIHPSVAMDLRAETDLAGWRYPQNYGAGDGLMGIFAGEIGTYEGVRWIETPRASFALNADDVKIYNTYVMGDGALAEAVASEFSVVLDGTVVDPLKRKTAIGWYGIAGWSLFRPEALWVVKSASTADKTA